MSPLLPVRLLATALLAAAPVAAQESIRAEEFAARCDNAGGHLRLDADLQVIGGAARLAACSVALNSHRLQMEEIRLSSSGFFMVEGQPDGELLIERSTLTQDAEPQEPVNILLRAHHLRIRSTLVDFGGTVHLETGMGDDGQMEVELCLLRSQSADVRVGASGNFERGLNSVRASALLAATDIQILASFREPGLRGGMVDLEESALISSGDIILQTGDEGETSVHRNGIIRAAGTVTLISAVQGETQVDENVVFGQQVQIDSGGHTLARSNNFLGSGDVVIEGPVCEAEENIPDVHCVTQDP